MVPSDELAPYWYSRFFFERGLALIYLIAFIAVVNQFIPLLGERGLLPVPRFTEAVPFRVSPSLFYFRPTDAAFRVAGWLGILVSLVALTGLVQRRSALGGAIVWALLWILYLSFVNVGQTFYGFGWESLLLELGFFTIFFPHFTFTLIAGKFFFHSFQLTFQLLVLLCELLVLRFQLIAACNRFVIFFV